MKAEIEPIEIDLQLGPRGRGNELISDFRRLRAVDPVHWSDRSHCWILTRHKDVADVFGGRLPLQHGGRIEAFSLAALSQKERAERIPNVCKYVPKWIVNLDGDSHIRDRTLLLRAFSRGIVERVREYARSRAETLLDQYMTQSCVEFNEQIARPLTGYVLFKLVGLPESEFSGLKHWSTALVEGLGASSPSIEKLERVDWALSEMNRVVLTELNKRKSDPKDDLITTLLQATEDGRSLTTDELLAQMQVIIVAGHDTTANTMTLGIEALHRHPAAWRQMRDQPQEMPGYIAELQRYVAMSGGQGLIATEDFELHGKHIKQGQVVMGAIMAADRDPQRFDDAESFDLNRNNKDSLVFAPGPHFCLGHVLAKMQLAEFFSVLVRRVDSVEILDEELNFMPVFTFRGLYDLNLRFHARKSP